MTTFGAFSFRLYIYITKYFFGILQSKSKCVQEVLNNNNKGATKYEEKFLPIFEQTSLIKAFKFSVKCLLFSTNN
jgi:hypothetical protein